MKNDPYWIVVKYPGQCKACSKQIAKGERAFYYPKGRHLFCDSDDCGQQQARDFETACFDERACC